MKLEKLWKNKSIKLKIKSKYEDYFSWQKLYDGGFNVYDLLRLEEALNDSAKKHSKISSFLTTDLYKIEEDIYCIGDVFFIKVIKS